MIHWPSWFWKFTSFTKFVTFSAIISSIIFVPHSFASLSRTLMSWLLDFWNYPTHIWSSVHFLQRFFLCCSEWIFSINLSSLDLSTVISVCYWFFKFLFYFCFLINAFIFRLQIFYLVLFFITFRSLLRLFIHFKSILSYFLEPCYASCYKLLVW